MPNKSFLTDMDRSVIADVFNVALNLAPDASSMFTNLTERQTKNLKARFADVNNRCVFDVPDVEQYDIKTQSWHDGDNYTLVIRKVVHEDKVYEEAMAWDAGRTADYDRADR